MQSQMKQYESCFRNEMKKYGLSKMKYLGSPSLRPRMDDSKKFANGPLSIDSTLLSAKSVGYDFLNIHTLDFDFKKIETDTLYIFSYQRDQGFFKTPNGLKLIEIELTDSD